MSHTTLTDLSFEGPYHDVGGQAFVVYAWLKVNGQDRCLGWASARDRSKDQHEFQFDPFRVTTIPKLPKGTYWISKNGEWELRKWALRHLRWWLMEMYYSGRITPPPSMEGEEIWPNIVTSKREDMTPLFREYMDFKRDKSQPLWEVAK